MEGAQALAEALKAHPSLQSLEILSSTRGSSELAQALATSLHAYPSLQSFLIDRSGGIDTERPLQ